MSGLVEVAVGNLNGTALDWAVLKSEHDATSHGELTFEWREDHIVALTPDGNVCYLVGRPASNIRLLEIMLTYWIPNSVVLTPSTNWSQGGPLIDRLAAKGFEIGRVGVVNGSPVFSVDSSFYQARGSTLLVAACRAIVAAKLGALVSIPTELASSS